MDSCVCSEKFKAIFIFYKADCALSMIFLSFHTCFLILRLLSSVKRCDWAELERWSVGANMEGCVRKGGSHGGGKQNEARRQNRLISSKNCRQTDIVEGRLTHDAKEATETLEDSM